MEYVGSPLNASYYGYTSHYIFAGYILRLYYSEKLIFSTFGIHGVILPADYSDAAINSPHGRLPQVKISLPLQNAAYKATNPNSVTNV